MIDIKNTLAPYIDGPGFILGVAAATVLQGGVIYNVPLTFVGLTANSTSYVFFNGTAVQVNTSGFSPTVYPIAVVTTNNTGITTLIDSRPDILININPGGSSSDSIQLVNTSQAIDFAGASNTLVLATSGAGGITITLPSAVGVGGQTVKVKKVDSGVGAVAISTVSVQTIDGILYGTSYNLTNLMQYVALESDGSNWNIVANN